MILRLFGILSLPFIRAPRKQKVNLDGMLKIINEGCRESEAQRERAMSGTKALDRWEVGKAFPLDQAQNNGKAFLWSECSC